MKLHHLAMLAVALAASAGSAAAEEGSLHQRALDAVGELLFGWIPS